MQWSCWNIHRALGHLSAVDLAYRYIKTTPVERSLPSSYRSTVTSGMKKWLPGRVQWSCSNYVAARKSVMLEIYSGYVGIMQC